MHQLELTIATPLDVLYKDSVDQVTVTTSSGEITILPNHIPLISRLKVGHVLVKKGDNETYFAISGGILEVRRDHSVIVLTNRSECVDDIDLERAEKAVERAQEYLKDPSVSEYNYKKLQAMMAKEENRARLAKKGHRK